MKNKILIFVSLTITFAAASCGDDFIEKNLKKQKITVLSPTNNYVSSSTSIIFWWEEVKGADEYKLQVVSPSFINIQSLVLDTTISNDKFIYGFDPNSSYQWRIKAVNSSSETEYAIFNFSIDSTLDLTNQMVQLISPEDDFASDQFSQKFQWQKLAVADDYRFEILNSLNALIATISPLTSDTVSYTFSTEGTYNWRVQAHSNNGTSSAYSIVNTIIIDKTAPQVSSPTLPAYNDTASSPVALQWERFEDTIKDSIFIAADSLFVTVIKQDIATVTVYNFTTTSPVHYFWRLKSTDKAGNWSGFSIYSKFRVN